MGRILRIAEVTAVIRRGRSSIYADVKAGRFPKPIALGLRSRGWLASEIEEWIRARADERKTA